MGVFYEVCRYLNGFEADFSIFVSLACLRPFAII